MSCLKLGLKAVLRDNFLTELNEEGNGYLPVYAQEQVPEKPAVRHLQGAKKNVHWF